MKNSFFSKFTPKEPKFFPLLKSLAEVSDKAAEQLIACVENNNNSDTYLKIRDLEHDGDRILSKIYDELNTTFITPFDREDINTLANMLDNVIDQIYGCVKCITFYKPKSMPDAAIQLVKLVKEATEFMTKAVDELHVLKRNANRIKHYCKELHLIESKADDVFHNFTIQLFEKETDAIEIIKLKDIMSVLETITDETDHVSKIIKTIIVKYA